jgi:ABC-type transporter Mla MlaB component
MTLRIDRFTEEHGIRIRLSGEMRREQIPDVRAELDRIGQHVLLDLSGLALVDICAVHFLNTCEASNISVVNCPPYIREWMSQELGARDKSEGA